MKQFGVYTCIILLSSTNWLPELKVSDNNENREGGGYIIMEIKAGKIIFNE